MDSPMLFRAGSCRAMPRMLSSTWLTGGREPPSVLPPAGARGPPGPRTWGGTRAAARSAAAAREPPGGPRAPAEPGHLVDADAVDFLDGFHHLRDDLRQLV